LIDDAEHAPAFDCETNLNCEISVARDKTVRPVERVYHPDAPLREPSLCVN
jgi:hypothetical protein